MPPETADKKIVLLACPIASFCEAFKKHLEGQGFAVTVLKKETPADKNFYAVIDFSALFEHLNPLKNSSLRLMENFKGRYIFASSVFVFSGVLSKSSLLNYYGDNTDKYENIEYLRYCESLLYKKLQSKTLKPTILRFGEIYGDTVDYGTIFNLITEALKSGEINLNSRFLEKNFYTNDGDVFLAVVKTLQQDASVGKIISPVSASPVALLEVAQIIKDFSKASIKVLKNATNYSDLEPQADVQKTCEEIAWKPSVLLKDGILKLFLKLKKEKEVVLTHTEVPHDYSLALVKEPFEKKQKFPKVKLSKKKATALVLITLVSFILVPLIFNLFNVILGTKYLNSSFKELQKFNLDKAKTFNSRAMPFLSNARSAPYLIGVISKKMDKSSLLGQYPLVLESLYYVGNAQKAAIQFLEKGSFVLQGISPNSPFFELSPNDIANLNADLFEFNNNLMILQASRKRITNSFYNNYFSKLDNPKIPEIVNALTNFLPKVPEILGYNSAKNYLILFQNSNELRATGGFIGSFAKVAVENGKIQDISVDDIYNVDGRLDEKGVKVAPPEPVKILLKQEDLRIRDANWDPFFPNSANTIMTLFNKADGSTYDGVVAVDISFLKNLLFSIGGVYLAFYDQTITADNLYEKTQYYSEKEYFEGSPQKKVFLSNLSFKIMQTLFEKNLVTPEFIGSLWQALLEKHLLVYFKEYNFLSELGFDGSQVPYSMDYVYVVDSNMGGSKSNYYIDRSTLYSIKNTDRDGSLISTLSIGYNHKGQADTWPSGDYTNYLRVYVPESSELLSATLYSGDKKMDITKGIVVKNFAKLKSFETTIVVKARELVRVEFTYKNLSESFKLDNILKNKYSLVVQKQPGTEADPFSFEFFVPVGSFSKKINASNLNFEVSNGIIKKSTNLKTDINLNLNFAD